MTSAVLFDVDGTLVDSNDAQTRAWVSALAEAGFAVPFERIRPLIGMGGDRVLPQVAHGLSAQSDRGKAITHHRMKIYLARELATVRPFRGAHEMLEAIHERGGRVVIATSAKREELDNVLALGHFERMVDIVTTSDDAEASKPAPDIIDVALRKADVVAREAVMVGDTHYDIDSAHKAHVACVALRCGGNDEDSLVAAEAIYGDPYELTVALDRQPFSWARSLNN